MSSMRAAAALVFLCATATAAAAQDDHFPQGRIVGSVEIPALHGAINRGAPEPADPKPVTLYVEPKAGSRAAAVLRTSKDVVSIEHGVNNSSEKHNQGFTHVYQVTFTNAAARDAYLPHPAHKAFGELLGKLGVLEDVFVVDYTPEGR